MIIGSNNMYENVVSSLQFLYTMINTGKSDSLTCTHKIMRWNMLLGKISLFSKCQRMAQWGWQLRVLKMHCLYESTWKGVCCDSFALGHDYKQFVKTFCKWGDIFIKFTWNNYFHHPYPIIQTNWSVVVHICKIKFMLIS